MKIVTANRLETGRVIYWTAGRDWSAHFADAAMLDGDDAETELALAQAREVTDVVAPYLMEVAEGVPAGRDRLKESIRLNGPTVGPSKGHGAAAG